ncbi:MAG TPA: glycosyltransferase family 1 protein [Desulfonatronum sp.]|nr:glycosyltransferase family 1 protein [Desulfonatronum sp.]
MTRLTIVHTEASDAWGGQDIRVYNEALWFLRHGHRVFLFNPARGHIYRRAKRDGLECTAVSFSSKARFQDFARLVVRLHHIKPDILCTHSSVDSWVGLLAARFCRVPVSVRYRHVSTSVQANFMNRWQYQSLCDHVVTTASMIRHDLRKTFVLPENKVSIVPTGIDFPDMPSRTEAKRHLLQRLGLPSDALLVGQVSVLRSWKGQYVLIDAFERLASQIPQSYLLLVGEGPVRNDYARRIRRSPVAHRMLLVGHQEDVWPFFRGMDVAVLSSRKNEGIPQVGLQAMFAGCSFVGTNIGGIPEIVCHEQTGLLARPSDPDDLAAAITRLLWNPGFRNHLAENALNMVKDHYTLDHMGQKMESLFQKLVAAKRAVKGGNSE